MKKILIIAGMVLACFLGKSQSAYVEVTLPLPDPCSTTSVHHFVGATPDNALMLVVAPNPSAGNFYCKLSGDEPLGEINVSVLDMKGVLLQQDKWYSENATLQTQMELNSLPNGIYLLSVSTKKNKANAKIIIEK